MQTKIVGGEQELENKGLYCGVTNSGRSSLRWILSSMSLQGKKVLVPDYLCQIVIDVLHEFDNEIKFYHVEDDFEFSFPNDSNNIDAIYLVKYFGHQSHAFKTLIKTSNIPIIIDDVFGIFPPVVDARVHWCYFNSLRKISEVTDYSEIHSNFPLSKIVKEENEIFSSEKLQGKYKKFDFMNKSMGVESSYLNAFNEAEEYLDLNKVICRPSDNGITLSGRFLSRMSCETEQRLKNRNMVLKIISKFHKIRVIDIDADFYSFQPIVIECCRDKIRKELFNYNVFLAVHWPRVSGSTSTLPDKVLSIPLDSRYSEGDMKELCQLIISLVRRSSHE
ncbi:pyridoxal phosphate-dependent transferase [Shewanella putrefaciens]|uniref:pyridoxal phosphate-dependent transferase n=1 Tax=unclassified Shewanella TaxID=196818 RepID=UPI0020065D37|nr:MULTISPECIES: pyridoxal phosphate-dependent transferase [unclassified Shewanella]MCK7630246.1 pyridoxal phosphate-dependent transferase [Shewanella sp. JNE9-1]MCK7653406.1 pyridoxal phosphate-dependent transferase [Shewanella sp. JNE4-1]